VGFTLATSAQGSKRQGIIISLMSYLLFISCLCQDKHYKNRVVLYFIPIDQNVPKARDAVALPWDSPWACIEGSSSLLWHSLLSRVAATTQKVNVSPWGM